MHAANIFRMRSPSYAQFTHLSKLAYDLATNKVRAKRNRPAVLAKTPLVKGDINLASPRLLLPSFPSLRTANSLHRNRETLFPMSRLLCKRLEEEEEERKFVRRRPRPDQTLGRFVAFAIPFRSFGSNTQGLRSGNQFFSILLA